MNRRRLQSIFASAIALASLGARGGGCGPCGNDFDEARVVLLPHDGDAGGDSGIPADGGPLPDDRCKSLCGPSVIRCSVDFPGGAPTLHCIVAGGCGAGRGSRRVARVAHDPSEIPADPCAAHWTEVARLEAASVVAFADLRAELRALGAPRSLLRASSRARRDEIRHARSVRALARANGAAPRSLAVGPRRPRSLEAFARENAIEGCVRETYGALLCTWQAKNARDVEVRARMARIASDETRHAELSWRVHRHVVARLDRSARDRLLSAMREAFRALRDECASPPTALVAAGLVPDAHAAQAMLDCLESACFSGARATLAGRR